MNEAAPVKIRADPTKTAMEENFELGGVEPK
jgi:hypothetical protein